MAEFFHGFNTNALMPTPLQTANPLEMARQAQELQNARLSYSNGLLGNKIQQAEYDARIAQGRALASSVGADGQPDQGAFRARAAADPAAAYGLQDAIGTSQDQELKAIHNSDAARNSIASVLSFVGANPDAAHLSAGGRMAKAVLPRSQWGDVDSIVNQIAQNPDGIAGGVAQIVNSIQGSPGQEANVYGSSDTVSNGAGTYAGTRSSPMFGSEFHPTQYTHASPSEAQLLSPVTVKDPETGKDKSMPLGEYLRQQGVTLQSAPIQNVTPAGALPAGAENYPWNSGRYEGTPTAGGAQNAPVAPGLTASLSPGQMAAADSAGHAAGQQYAEAGQRAAGFAANTFQAKKALQGLEELGPYSQGKAGVWRNALVNGMQSLGYPVDPGKTATYDETNKYLVQMAMGQPGAAHSDQQLATALTANPSMHINNLAAQDVLRASIALARRANGAYQAFAQKYPGTSAQTHADEWPQFATDYTQHRDARAYMWDLMDDKQRSRVWNGLDQKQKAAFAAQVQEAQQSNGAD